MTVLVSAILALTGRDTVEGSGSKVGLAQAIHHFRPDGPNKLTVLVQKGRITPPRSNSKILVLLDRFIREMANDQRKNSWHAKAALVRFVEDSAATSTPGVEWRLWIGSRNLTRDMSWDSGLILSSCDANSHPISGIQDLAEELLDRADLKKGRSAQLLAEIGKIHWEFPKHTNVRNITWLRGSQRWSPDLPAEIDDLVVVTPFFDLPSIQYLERIGGASVKRTLLTTQMELDNRLSAKSFDLSKWNVLCLESSQQTTSMFDGDLTSENDSLPLEPEPIHGDDELAPMGLHAKLIAVRSGKKTHLIMGSPNITQRAWSGNTEVIVALDGEDALWQGITALLNQANYADLDNIPANPDTTTRKSLDEIRNALCNIQLRQILDKGSIQVHADQPIKNKLNYHELKLWMSLDIRLDISPMGSSEDEVVEWRLDDTNITLPNIDNSLSGESELLCFRLSATSSIDSRQTIKWLQRVPLFPSPDSGRDRRIIANYLNPSQFLNWVNGMLEGYESDATPWVGELKNPGTSFVQNKNSVLGDIPTTEALIRAWQRDKESIEHIANAFDRYFDAELLRVSHQNEFKNQLDILVKFRRQLDMIRLALVKN